MVDLNVNLKMLGLFPVPVILHPEVKVDVTVNIARTADEAKTQRETGIALINVEDDFDDEVESEEATAENEEGAEVSEDTEAA